MLHSVNWYFVTDVSGQPIGPNGQTAQEESREHSGSAAGKYVRGYSVTLEDWTDRLSRNVSDKLPIYAV